MQSLTYKQNKLFFYDVDLSSLVGPELSPTYLYHRKSIADRAKLFMETAQKHLKNKFSVHYAMKANYHPEIIKTLLSQGIGIDVVSGGELTLSQSLGTRAENIIYSGVGKTKKEIREAIIAQIKQINVESLPELERISVLSTELKKTVKIALRVNPNVDVKTHPHIATGLRDNKFGIEVGDVSKALEIIQKNKYIQLQGLSLHIGSQIFDFSPLKMAIEKLREVYQQLESQGIVLKNFDIGGGVGVNYQENGENDHLVLNEYFKTVADATNSMNCDLLFEPGRFLVSRSGILLTEIQYIKQTPWKTFVICNTGMNHILRPVLYEAHHRIMPLQRREGSESVVDIVGPVCESADFLAKKRSLPPVLAGDILAIGDAGAYGKVMSSHYNLFPEVLEKVL